MPVLRLEWLWDVSSMVWAERLSNVYVTSQQRKPTQSLLAILLPWGFSNPRWKMLSESTGQGKHLKCNATALLAVVILSQVCFFIEESRGLLLLVCPHPPPHSRTSLHVSKVWFRDLGKYSKVIHGQRVGAIALPIYLEREEQIRQRCLAVRNARFAAAPAGLYEWKVHTLASMWPSSVWAQSS